MDRKIHIVGAIGSGVTVSDEDVRQTLAHPVRIGQDEGFRGKVSTRLYASRHHVLKLKSGFALDQVRAERWCQLQIERERDYGIYPPHRHWLVMTGAGGCAVANISRKGITLERMLTDPALTGDNDATAALLAGLFERYFRFWQLHELRQDEGLTNYIVESGRLYYVDDDIYPRDNLVSFAHSLCGILRRLSLDKPVVERVACALREQLTAIDGILPAVLAEQMREVFLPPDRSLLRHVMLDILEQYGERARSPCHERVAILADIHGNFPALQAVLASMDREGLSHAVVLGDIVGYGPQPGECVDLIKQKPWLFLRGNHDHAAALGEAGPGFSSAARWSTPWTASRLTRLQRDWLGQLPLIWRDGMQCAVHGAPADPTFFNGYVYPATAERNLDSLKERDIQVCFHGHSHMAGIFRRNAIGIDERLPPAPITLDARSQYLVCPGSVGQPRDGCPDAQYAIFDRHNSTLEFRTVPYDKEALARAIRSADLPDFIARQFHIDLVTERT